MQILSENKNQINQQDLEQRVKNMYKAVALNPEKQYHFEMGRALAERLGYPAHILDLIPAEAIASFAGVGYYFDLARIQKGEFVVDLGSGSGMDAFCAALKVGQNGEVIGLDMTAEQLAKSNQLRRQFQLKNIYFLESYIEQPYIVSNSIDTVISNGVINLSLQKARVFKEVARILKPGGRLALADIVSTKTLPTDITCNASYWASCIGGAIQEEHYFELIQNAGLKIETVKENPYEFLSKGALGATKQYGIKSLSILAVKR